MKRSFWIVAIILALAGATLLTALKREEPSEEAIRNGPSRAPRRVEGIVRGPRGPLAGARVRLFEHPAHAFQAETVSSADGRFRLMWRPETTTRSVDLFLEVAPHAAGLGTTVARAHPGRRNEVRIARAAREEGRVLDLAGRPLPGARVLVSAHNALAARSYRAGSGDGRFGGAGPISLGTPLDILVVDAGHAARFENRFRAGDELILHLAPGHAVQVVVRDPDGRPVPEAEAHLEVPFALREAAPRARADARGRIELADASDGGACLVVIAAPRYLGVRVPAWAGRETPVVLWPARETELLVWDAWNSAGVEGASFEVQLASEQAAGQDWWGGGLGLTEQLYEGRPGRAVGVYRLRLPTCAAEIVVRAPGYAGGRTRVASGATRAVVRLTPPRARKRPAQLEIAAPGLKGRLPLVLQDPITDWATVVSLVGGRARAQVPAQRKLRVASAGAGESGWVPQQDVTSPRAGRLRRVRLIVREAVALEVATDPPVAGGAVCTDLSYAKAAPPRRARLTEGRARFWVRPRREVRIEIEPEGDYFEAEGDFKVDPDQPSWTAHLRQGARARFRIADEAGHPVPFAEARLWEPDSKGRLGLRSAPAARCADAEGRVDFRALREGEAAAEFGFPGFGLRRLGVVRLRRDTPFEGGTVTLAPAGIVRGRLATSAGTALAGLGVRVLAPLIYRLRLPGGGERLLYDLTAGGLDDAISGEDGRFAVRDAAPRDPLLAVDPGGRSDLAPAAFEISGGREGVYEIPPSAYLEIALSGSVEGVYRLLPGALRAVKIRSDPPMGLRPLPVVVPAGRISLYLLMRDRRWAAFEIDLASGTKQRIEPTFHPWRK